MIYALDRTNPLTRGVLLAVRAMPGGTTRDFGPFARSEASRSGSPTQVAGPGGEIATAFGTDTHINLGTDDPFNPTTDYTCLAYMRTTDTSGTSFSVRHDNGTWGVAVGIIAGAGVQSLYAAGGGSHGWRVDSSGENCSDGEWTVIGHTLQSTGGYSLRYYRDGRLLSDLAYGFVRGPAAGGTSVLVSASGSGFKLTQDFVCGFLWGRVLAPAEVAEFSRDPMALFFSAPRNILHGGAR